MWSFNILSIFHVKEACLSFIYMMILVCGITKVLLWYFVYINTYPYRNIVADGIFNLFIYLKFQIQVTNLAPLSISDYWKLENEYNAFRKIDQKAIKVWMSHDKMHHIAHMCGLPKRTRKLLLNPSQNMAKITMEIWTPKYLLHKLILLQWSQFDKYRSVVTVRI